MENYQDTKNTLGYKWLACKYNNSLFTYTKWSDCQICGQEGILPHLSKHVVWDSKYFCFSWAHWVRHHLLHEEGMSPQPILGDSSKSADFWAFLLPHLLMFMIRG